MVITCAGSSEASCSLKKEEIAPGSASKRPAASSAFTPLEADLYSSLWLEIMQSYDTFKQLPSASSAALCTMHNSNNL